MIQVIVFYSLKEEFSTQFTKVFKALEPHVQAEEGCLQYEVFVSPIISTRFCLVEKWLSQEALYKHMKTKQLADFREQSESWFEQKPVIELKTIENERYL